MEIGIAIWPRHRFVFAWLWYLLFLQNNGWNKEARCSSPVLAFEQDSFFAKMPFVWRDQLDPAGLCQVSAGFIIIWKVITFVYLSVWKSLFSWVFSPSIFLERFISVFIIFRFIQICFHSWIYSEYVLFFREGICCPF